MKNISKDNIETFKRQCKAYRINIDTATDEQVIEYIKEFESENTDNCYKCEYKNSTMDMIPCCDCGVESNFNNFEVEYD